ncbi:MAG: AtpZ/AtpI family protein [Bacteroidetes bacterium]|nr:AtpZ/AtpI family protein [Bacteroidota bacterium]
MPKKSANNYTRYSAIGLQLAATIFLLTYGGYKLDERLNTSPVFTLIFSIVAVFGGMYWLIKQLSSIDKK